VSNCATRHIERLGIEAPSPSTRKHFLSQTLAASLMSRRRRRGRSLSASKPNRKKSHEGGAERAITVKALHNAG
jgi:hypothetical protein